MNTIMTIAYNANKISALGNAKKETANESKVRLIYDLDSNELHLIDGIQKKLEVIHPVHDSVIHLHAENIIATQKKVTDAVRIYEDRIYKRPPLDHMA